MPVLTYPGTNVPIYGYEDTTTGTPPNTNLGSYSQSPLPRKGQGPYGLVPGNIATPPSTYSQTLGVAPGLGGPANTQLTDNILHELQGDINPQALKNMQDAAAAYGISSGMPGSNAIPGSLIFNKNLRNIGLDTMAVQQQGGKDYLSALSGIGAQQLSPALLAEIAAHNAQLNAAPDPEEAARRLVKDYQNSLAQNRGPAGGTGQYQSPFGSSMGNGGGALGFGFGGFGNDSGSGTGPSRNSPGYSGQGYGGVPGGAGLSWNPETGEFQTTEPSGYSGGLDYNTWGMDPSGTAWSGADASYTGYWDPNNYDWGTGYDQTDYGDAGYYNDLNNNMSNEDYFYNMGGF